MFSLLRMDLYRMSKSTSFWVCMAVMVGMILFAVGTIWAVSNINLSASENNGLVISAADANSGITIGEGELNESDIAEIEEANSILTKETDVLSYLANMGTSGELLAVIIAVFAALFIAGEFESGFSKNVFSTVKSRRSYFASKAIALLAAIVSFVVVATIVSVIAGLIVGFTLTGVAVGEFLAWMGITILSFWALAMLVALFAWLTKTKTGALLIGIFVGVGMVGGIIAAIVSYIPGLEFIKDFLLYSNWIGLGSGFGSLATADIVRMTCVGLGYLVLYSVLGMFVLQKRDI